MEESQCNKYAIIVTIQKLNLLWKLNVIIISTSLISHCTTRTDKSELPGTRNPHGLADTLTTYPIGYKPV